MVRCLLIGVMVALGSHPCKGGIFRDFRGFAVIEACSGGFHSSGEPQERAR